MRSPGRNRRHQPFRASLERLESRQLLATFTVRRTADPLLLPPDPELFDRQNLSLREAILLANARPGADNIVFAIPASTAANLDVPVPGFEPTTQTWRISLASPLPSLSDQVTIDGLTQANYPVPYRYPDQSSPDPIQISSSASTIAAKSGNNAILRVIVDGSQAGAMVGFDIRASHSILRGLIIDGFGRDLPIDEIGVGVSVSDPDAVGVLIQGNSIGQHYLYPVDPGTGEPLEGAAAAYLDGLGNGAQGVLLTASNATVGGLAPQEANIIGGNGLQGVSVLVGAVGNLIAGNQIGVAGPTTNGLFSIARNGAEGILIKSSGSDTSSSTTVDSNLISANVGDGVHVVGPPTGPASTRVNIIGNFVGAPPGGGSRFGSPDTGNLGDGVRIENAGDNRIGGSSDRDRNVITANEGAGIRVSGANAVGNLVTGNNIGVTVAGNAALGNSLEGVVLAAPDNTVGPNNVISANLRGVLLSGPGATGNLVLGNKIGTEAAGSFDLGNAQEGIRIDGASGNLVLGDAAGSQVISGNNVGILIIGAMASGNLVQGNRIGTDFSGTLPVGNSLEGVRIENAPGNTIGGTAESARNLISGNHWGMTLTGGLTTGNLVQGNFIGTDASGTLPLGNELDGVLVTNAASANTIGGVSTAGRNVISANIAGVTLEGLFTFNNLIQGNFIGTDASGSLALGNVLDGVRAIDGASENTIGGPSVAEGNAIAFNRRDGVRVVAPSSRNSILTNRIFLNGGLGIRLLGGNLSQPAPSLDSVDVRTNVTTVSGTVGRDANTTYRIQFFAVMPPDPSGSGEGDIYLGEAFVSTDASGLANFSAQIPVALAPGQQVTATATDRFGNTSEFSGARVERPTTISFSAANYTVSEDGMFATIKLKRSGAIGSSATVYFSTSDGTARAGVDYLPVSTTVTFDPDKDEASVRIQILLNPEVEGVETVILNLANPTGGATLVPPSSAILSIIDDTTDRTAPKVVSARAVAGKLGVAAVIIAFDEPLDPARAIDLLNYGYSVRYAGRDGRLGTRDDLLLGIASASLDSSGRVVTLLLARPIHKKAALRLMINQATDVEGAGVGVSDLAGNLLDGDANGRPGGPYVTRVVTRQVPQPRRAAGRGGKAPRQAR
ncbi:Calx-beta domain-containing protein [Tundrisphaera sp. TA3]|uniref:Calx-beta domain-containing protein n=1 Tax=Tundrisphaera sp. TA3 TaxID=3435775 RepID=UPI003EBAAEA6